MLEHLDRAEARAFLGEVRRVLAPGAIVRLAVPDISRLVSGYLRSGDADAFVASTLLATSRPRGPVARLRAAVVGGRDHAWMYDGASLCQLLIANGFVDAQVLAAGETTIPLPAPLDLQERADESVYVEARRDAHRS